MHELSRICKASISLFLHRVRKPRTRWPCTITSRIALENEYKSPRSPPSRHQIQSSSLEECISSPTNSITMYKYVILVAVCVVAAHAGLIGQPLVLPLAPIVKPAPQIISTPLIKSVPLIIPQQVPILKSSPLVIPQQISVVKSSPWVGSPIIKSGLGLDLGGPLVGGW